MPHPFLQAPLKLSRGLDPRFRFIELRRTVGSVDEVGDLYVVDIGGNKYRLVSYVRFDRQSVLHQAGDHARRIRQRKL
ncbi:MAG: type II toxin-antitoxin system HigB family toxin [Gammaproteobacteria bacterium]|nr:type II toxin-antitoxin system HigB family toxin [Gammaproteobacteria bacterium]